MPIYAARVGAMKVWGWGSLMAMRNDGDADGSAVPRAGRLRLVGRHSRHRGRPADPDGDRRSGDAPATSPDAGRWIHQSLADALGQPVVATDTAGVVGYWNAAAEVLYGWSPGDAIGRPLGELILPTATAGSGSEVLSAITRGRPWNGELHVRHRSGRTFPVVLTSTPVSDAAGSRAGSVNVSVDLSQGKAGMEFVTVLAALVEASQDAIISTSADDVIRSWNAAAERMFGYRSTEIIGQPIAVLIPEELRAESLGGIDRNLRHGRSIRRMRTVSLRKDGSRIEVETTAAPILSGDNEVIGIASITRDVTAEVAAERALAESELRFRSQALTDALTGLPNRALLHDVLADALLGLRADPGFVGVLFLDLDRFKVVNDSLGHEAGDDLLRRVGQHISQVLGVKDTLTRFGGDEFVIVPHAIAGPEDLITLAKRILAVFARPIRLGDIDVTSAASIGLALTSDATCTAESLLRNADLAMYRAKSRGGGAYEVFDQEMLDRAKERLVREAQLRRAMEAGELRVHYQPCVRADGRIAGVEALVRWAHPQDGLVLPGEFIQLAEESGLIVPLGAWVLREACAQVARWRAELRPDLELSVNLSGRQLADPKLHALVARTLTETGLDPSALWLEITETVLVGDPTAAAMSLMKIRDLGVRISVDDFGTGYGSLSYIRRFPVQMLKLDRSFVAGLGANAEDVAIARSVIGLAHALGLQSVAEGVETEEQLMTLVSLGCDFMQGFYWSAVVDALAMADMLRRGSLDPAPSGPGARAGR